MQDSTLAYVKPHPVSYCPALQPVQVSLNGRTAFRRVSQSSQLRVISKLAEGGHYPLIKVVDEDVEQDWTQHRPLGDTTSHRPPARHRTANDNPLHSASQPILDPLHCPLIYPILPQLCYKDVMGDRIKSLTEIKVDYIYRSPPVHPASDIFIKGHQLSGDGIQHKLFHHLPWDRVFRHLPSSPRPLKNYRERLKGSYPGLLGEDLGSYGGKEGRREGRNGKKDGSKKGRETNGQRFPSLPVRSQKAECGGIGTRSLRHPRVAAPPVPWRCSPPGRAVPVSLNGRRARLRHPGHAPFICIMTAARTAIGCRRAGSSVTSALAG
ncbi:uncharacterized protein [Excalfactoria chinensis]|uniref:uncharacterized protein n=1 Tax=Excalfactoria chinensis TaxID=46218 RepID=UPI003B3ACACD